MRCRGFRKRKRDIETGFSGRSGIALLMVLWVLTILMVVVFSFASMTKSETQAALSFKQQSAKRLLAEAGIERGIMEIFYRKQNISAIAMEGMEVWRTDRTPYRVDSEDGYAIIMVMDESGKININTLSDASGIILKNLLMNSGVQEEIADTIVDSVLDWRDPDDLVRLHGAESDYYRSLPAHYSAKNADFDTLEELLLVKGVTPEILFGSGKKRGIIDFLTINSKTNQINLMAAPREVLAAIPGLGPEDVQGILDLRENQNDPTNAQTISSFVQKITPPFNSFVNSGANSMIYTVEALGRRGDDKAGYGIRATVNIGNVTGQPAAIQPASVASDANKPPYTYLYFKSPAEVIYDNNNSNSSN